METGVKSMIWKSKFGHNKVIPEKYNEVILQALSHYPELADTHIAFKLTTNHPVPHGTAPTFGSLVTPGIKRKYVISILEEAKPPMRDVLFKNLPEQAQLGVLGHELGHVLQFESLKTSTIMTKLFFTNSYKVRDMERTADRLAIEHNLGRELHVHALYIRQVDGYTDLRPEIDINYMKPHEILQGITAIDSGGIGV